MALKRAADRGAGLRVSLDPNHDAFGKRKDGIPNRPVAKELVDHGIEVRWCKTQGEQCHSKLLQVVRADGRAELIAGSANFTRRSLDNLNLETRVRLTDPVASPALAAAKEYFQ
jgi:phosphatidylserine/phosphatidylglycerophosphate/cardiolipin synthase-like enzyme